MLSAFFDRLAAHASFMGVTAGLVFVAYLINRFAPQERRHLRRVATLFGLYLVTVVVSSALHVAGSVHLWHATHVAASMLEAFTAVNLVALAIFDVILPAIKMQAPTIAADLIVGIAYLAATMLILIDEGFNPASVLGASAVASAILVVSLQSTLGNILGGLAIQVDGSIHTGDWIQLENGRQGKVKDIRWRHTAIETRDWDTIIVPNSTLLAQSFTILGRRTGQPSQHRMWVYFNVDFRHTPTQVISVVNEALQAAPIPNVARTPPPHAICYDLAKDTRDSFAYYAVRYYLTDFAVDDPTSSAVRARIYAALRRASIPLARPASTAFFAPNEDSDDPNRMERLSRRRLLAIESMDIFRILTNEERSYLAGHLRYAPFTFGETMTRQGAVAHWLYILTSGKAEVRAHAATDDKGTRIAVLEAPAFFGEMGMMTGAPRAADVIALTDAECYRLDKEGFQSIVKDRPEIVDEISETLAKRRVELFASHEDLDEGAKSVRQATEAAAILGRIRSFFALED